MKIKIAPSILSANRKKLQYEVKEIEKYADMIHVDVMDGKFVPPITFNADEVKQVKTKLAKDVHLMVEHPLTEGWINAFKEAGAAIITIHWESKDNTNDAIQAIRKRKCKVGISINPATPLYKIKPYLDKVDMVLIMSVNPGYSGQNFILPVLTKIRHLRTLKPKLDIEVDGGINRTIIRKAYKAGANIFVAGSAVFGKKDRKKAIMDLRNAVK
jgi:ribulose-phosphate 3-epimerase